MDLGFVQVGLCGRRACLECASGLSLAAKQSMGGVKMQGFKVFIRWILWKKGTFKVGSGLSHAAKQRSSGLKMHGFGICTSLTLWKKSMFKAGKWAFPRC